MVSVYVVYFWLYEVGQCLCALSKVFFLLLPAIFATTWFPNNEWNKVTAIGTFTNVLGVGLSLVVPSYVVTGTIGTPEEADRPTDMTGRFAVCKLCEIELRTLRELETQSQLRTPQIMNNLTHESNPEWDDVTFNTVKLQLTYLTACFAGFALIMFIVAFFSPGMPKYFPSLGAKLADKEFHKRLKRTKKKSFIRTLVEMKNVITKYPSFLVLCSSFGLIYGTLNGGLLGNLSVIISSSVTAECLENTEMSSGNHTGLIGLTLILAGGIGSLITGQIIDKTQKYKTVSIVVYGSTVVIYALFTGLLQLQVLPMLYVLMGLLGFTWLSDVPIAYGLGVKLTPAVPQAITASFLNFTHQLIGAIVTPVVAFTLQRGGVLHGNIVLLSLLVVGFMVNLFLSENNGKEMIEENDKINHQNETSDSTTVQTNERITQPDGISENTKTLDIGVPNPDNCDPMG